MLRSSISLDRSIRIATCVVLLGSACRSRAEADAARGDEPVSPKPPELEIQPSRSAGANAPERPTNVRPEEYRVYEALLFGMNQLGSPREAFLLRDTTAPEAMAEELARNVEGKLPKQLLKAFISANADPGTLSARHFKLLGRVWLATPETVRAEMKAHLLEPFPPRWPGVACYVTVSRVGFGFRGKQALVYFHCRQQLRVGSGALVHLIQRDGSWTIEKVFELEQT